MAIVYRFNPFTKTLDKIEDLSDFVFTPPIQDNEVLQYEKDTGKWENRRDLIITKHRKVVYDG